MAVYEIILFVTTIMWIIWLDKVRKYKKERIVEHAKIRNLITKMKGIPAGQSIPSPIAARVKAKLAYVSQKLKAC